MAERSDGWMSGDSAARANGVASLFANASGAACGSIATMETAFEDDRERGDGASDVRIAP